MRRPSPCGDVFNLDFWDFVAKNCLRRQTSGQRPLAHDFNREPWRCGGFVSQSPSHASRFTHHLSNLPQLTPEGGQRQGDELEMLFGKGQADNSNRQQNTRHKMRNGNHPAKQKKPDNVKNNVAQ